MKVTPEMIEAAEREYWRTDSDPEGARDMGAALNAALSASPAPAVPVEPVVKTQDEPQAPWTVPLQRTTEQTWKQVNNLFRQHGLGEPPVKLRDELVIALEWAWYGLERSRATPPAPAVPVELAVKSMTAKVYRKTALVTAEQFLPAIGQIPKGVYTSDFGDPKSHPLSQWVLDTKEGRHTLRGGDYICTGPAGEQWNVAQEIFEATYEEVATPPAPAVGDGWPDETAMRVIDPEQWEPCSPDYLRRGGDCAHAPRVWNAKSMNHWHPKLAASPATDLREENEWLKELQTRLYARLHHDEEALNKAEARAAAAEALLEKAREALKPFARFRTPAHLGAWTDSVGEHFSREQFEAARATLQELEGRG